MNRSLVVVFSGPSGAGKSTLLNMLVKQFPGRFAFSVSHTTRKIRQGEVDGQDYHFIEKEKMLKEIAAGKFLEHAEFAGNVYGTSRAAVQKVGSSACDISKIIIQSLTCSAVFRESLPLFPPRHLERSRDVIMDL